MTLLIDKPISTDTAFGLFRKVFEGFNCSELIPKEAKDFLTGLSDADKAVLKDIAKNYATYKNEEEVRILKKPPKKRI